MQEYYIILLMNMTRKIKIGLIGGLCGAGIGWLGGNYEIDRIAEPMRPLPSRIDTYKAQLQKVEHMRWTVSRALGEECVESIWDRLQFGLTVGEVSRQQRERNSQMCSSDTVSIDAVVKAVEIVRVLHTRVDDEISTAEEASSYLSYNDRLLNPLPLLTALGTGMAGAVAAVGVLDMLSSKENQ